MSQTRLPAGQANIAAEIPSRFHLRHRRIIKMWLKAPVEETDGNGKRRTTGGKRSTCGTPQGSWRLGNKWP